MSGLRLCNGSTKVLCKDIKSYFRHENKVHENKVSSYCEVLRYMQNIIKNNENVDSTSYFYFINDPQCVIEITKHTNVNCTCVNHSKIAPFSFKPALHKSALYFWSRWFETLSRSLWRHCNANGWCKPSIELVECTRGSGELHYSL